MAGLEVRAGKKWRGVVSDRSIWHGFPGGIHSLCKPNGLGKGNDFIGLDYFTNFFGLLNFLEIQVQGELGGRAIPPFALADWQWFASHLEGRWEAQGLVLHLRALLDGADRAVIRCELRNESGQPFKGNLSVLGDENLDTMGDWGKYSLAGSFRRQGNGVCVRKTLQIGESSDAFPWIGQTQYKGLIAWRWYELVDEWAVSLEGDGWRYAVRPGVAHPERKRVKLRADQLSFMPEAIDGLDRWSFGRRISLRAGQAFAFSVHVAFHYGDDKPLSVEGQRRLLRCAVKGGDSFELALRRSDRQWAQRLASVPRPRKALPESYRKLYDKAWAGVLQNLLPPHSGGLRQFRTPVFSTNKVATACLAPCAWESVLGSLLIGMVDVDLAARTLDAIVNCIEEDGVLLEDLGLGRASTLPSILAIAAWSLHQRGMGDQWLKRWYDRLKLNWRQQYRYPTWKRFGLILCRNYFYAYHNGQALLQIARLLRRSETELREMEHRLKDIRLSAQVFWDPGKQHFRANANGSVGVLSHAELLPGTNGEVLIGLLGDTMTPQQKQLMIRFIRERLLHGHYMIANQPQGVDGTIGGTASGTSADKEQWDFAIKPSAFLLLWPALKSLDRELFYTAVDRTLAGVAHAGDFAENYRLDGRMAHNQPMSFFGMFAVIWSVLCDDRYAPRGLKAANWI